jgi:myosin heavy subunit
MTTATSQDLKERMAAIFAEAKEQGLDLCDLFPPELRDYFQGSLLKQSEEMEEKHLDLKTQPQPAQQMLKDTDMSEDAKQLQIQLGLSKKSAEFYRSLMKEAEIRATKYQEKWQEALRKRAAAEEVEKTILRLEAENRDLQQSKAIIAEEMRKMEDIYDKLRDKDLAAIVEKEEKLMAVEKQLKELNTKSEELEMENSAVEGQYHEVMSSLDVVVTETTDDLNTAKARARVVDQQHSAAFSEMLPLRRFYLHANEILNIYQEIFKQLLNATEPNVTVSSDFREMVFCRLKAASDECEAFLTLRALFTAEGVPQTELSAQLNDLARSAQHMQKSLSLIGEDVAQFLWALQRRPDLRKLIRYKFGVLR